MNPHADSVPSQAQIDEVVYACRQQGSDTTYDIVRVALARFGTRPAAEPSQSGSAGEALLATAPKFEECETPEPSLSSLIYRYYRAHFEDRAQADGYASRYIAALSRQAPAAPAAKDFEQWWLAEVAANGGVPIGADYKHWAKKGFELRGDARAPAAPAEAGRSDQWGRLYTTANTLVASIGYMGEIDSRADEVASLMDALHDLDGGQWMPGLTPAASPAAPTQALLGWTRYEKARKLNPAQWAELHQRNLRGENFDDMIDALPASTQPAQQDTPFDQRPLVERAARIAEELDEHADWLTRSGRTGDSLVAAGARVIEELIAAAPQAPSGQQAEPMPQLSFQPSIGDQLALQEWYARALAGQQSERPAPAGAVYLVATGETVIGLETYTRHEGAPPPLSDYERLYTAAAPAGQAVGEVAKLRKALTDLVLANTAHGAIRVGDALKNARDALAASQAERPAVKEGDNHA